MRMKNGLVSECANENLSISGILNSILLNSSHGNELLRTVVCSWPSNAHFLITFKIKVCKTKN